MIMTAITTLTWLALNAYHEARGESDEGIKAVCHVVLNRADQRKLSAKDVVLQKYQFSWANHGARPPIEDYASLVRCMVLAAEAMEEHENGDTLGGADHYFADYIPKPLWANNMTHVKTVGKHLFYKA